jgi:hypothetical protein
MKQTGFRYISALHYYYESLANDFYQQDSHSGPGIAAFSKLLQDGQWSWNNVSFHSQDLNLACDHKAREQMFHTVLYVSHACLTLWKKRSRGNKDWIWPLETLIDEMHIPPSQFQWVRNLSLVFLNQSSRCRKCQLEAVSNHLPINNMKGPYLKGRAVCPP